MSIAILSGGAPALATDNSSTDNRLQLESTIDVSSLGTFSGDVTTTFSPLAAYWESGPRIRLTGAFARYQYWTDPERVSRVIGVDRSAEALFGYSFGFGRGAFTLTAGPIAVESIQTPSTRLLPPSETVSTGVKVHASLFAKPTDWSMVYLQGQYSSISESYSMQAKTGVAIAKNLFLGPDFAISGMTVGDPFGYQFRLGVHLTGVDLGFMQVGLSAGVVEHQDLGRGTYASTSLHIPF